MDPVLWGLIGVVLGAIISGVLTWKISNSSIRKEFQNQLKLNELKDINKEKSSFLTLKDEMEENRMVIQGYLNFMNSNSKQSIDFRKDNVNKARDQAWKQVRERIFLSKNKEIIKELSNFYKAVYGIQNVDLMPKEYVTEILKDCTKLMEEITEYIQMLENESINLRAN